VVQAPAAPVVQPAPPPRVAVATEISPPPAHVAPQAPPPPALDTMSPTRPIAPRMGGMVTPPPAPVRSPQTVSPPRPAPQAAVPQVTAAAATVTGLPPDAPKVSISGGVYSPSPAQRMLIVNGQVFNEGSEVAAGLVIEKIEPRTAVLKFRGALYTVAY
jgi:general secretion pathway protein B